MAPYVWTRCLPLPFKAVHERREKKKWKQLGIEENKVSVTTVYLCKIGSQIILVTRQSSPYEVCFRVKFQRLNHADMSLSVEYILSSFRLYLSLGFSFVLFVDESYCDENIWIITEQTYILFLFQTQVSGASQVEYL